MSITKLGSIGHAEAISVLLGNAKGCEDVLLSREDLNEINVKVVRPLTLSPFYQGISYDRQ